MARYRLLSYQLFFLLILFQAFSLIESAPMTYKEGRLDISTTDKTKYTFDLVSSDSYHVPSPVFYNATNTTEIKVTGPPGEIVLYVRSTRVSWDNRTIFTDRFIHQPRMRGTIGILFSCMFTLFLCVWTAFHANIVPQRENKKKGLPGHLSSLLYGNWRRKALWSVVIIIFPESSLFFALFERMQAKEICRSIDKVNELPENAPEGSSENKSSWNPVRLSKRFWGFLSELTKKIIGWLCGTSISSPKSWSEKQQLGYFALMGGFAIRDTRTSKGNKLIILTPCGVHFLCRYLEQADKLARTVDDKNRTSALAKCLVLFQVIWIIIQIILRYSEGFSVTLLETHTVIHGVCALMTYMIWFNKPFDVKHPIELELPDQVRKKLYGLFDGDNGGPHSPLRLGPATEDKGFQTECLDTEGEGPTLSLHPASRTPSTKREGSASLQSSMSRNPSTRTEGSHDSLIHKDSHPKWECMVPFTKRVGQTMLVSGVLIGGRRPFSSLPYKILRRLDKVWLEFLVMLMASIVYGGLHSWAFLAGHFPTAVERLLWQLALCSIAGGLLCCFLALIITRLAAKFSTKTSTTKSSNTEDSPSAPKDPSTFCLVMTWLFAVICLIALVFGVAARLYFFVESFAALRDPSAKAFRIVSWTNLSFI